MSAKPGRKRGYSPDIGWSAVWRWLGLDMRFRELSRHLQISTSTAHRNYKKFEGTGDVSPVRRNRCPDHRKLD